MNEIRTVTNRNNGEARSASRWFLRAVSFSTIFLATLVGIAWTLPATAEENAAAEKPAGETSAYAFKGGRDPFIPLKGQGAWTPRYGKSGEMEEFDPGSLELKGILKTKTGRWAVLRSANGGSYLIKDGKIQDPKRKSVSGYVGIVKEKSLVIIGPNNEVTEIPLKKNSQER